MDGEGHDLSASETRMPLTDHLGELRQVLVKGSIAVALCFAVTYALSDRIIGFLQQPLLKLFPENEKYLYFTGITDKFFVYIQVSLLTSVLFVLPYLLYLVWTFVSPALLEKERKVIYPFLFLSLIAFIIGLAFGYYVVIPYGYDYLINFGSPTEKPMITITEYFSLTTKLLGVVGLVFELPVVLTILGLLGIVTTDTLKKFRKQAFLVLTIVSAILTPSPDAFTMLLVAVPLCLLYEMSIWGVTFVHRRSSKANSEC